MKLNKLRNVLFCLTAGLVIAASVVAMDGNPGQVTYGCDWCREQKPVLNSHSAAAPYSGSIAGIYCAKIARRN